MAKFKVRTGTSRDIKELTRQRHGMFEDMHTQTKKDLKIHDGAFPRWVKRQMKAKRFVAFLVETNDGRVVGGGSLWMRDVQPYPGFAGGRVPYLMSMYTDPSFRGKGIGSMVVRHAIAWCRHHGYQSISLHASKMGRPLYEGMGWKRSNEMELDL
jgi:GNAT superfamily N-acetyltransferase